MNFDIEYYQIYPESFNTLYDVVSRRLRRAGDRRVHPDCSSIVVFGGETRNAHGLISGHYNARTASSRPA
jgi:hypothetical protein